jgi:hypothetical protein
LRLFGEFCANNCARHGFTGLRRLAPLFAAAASAAAAAAASQTGSREAASSQHIVVLGDLARFKKITRHLVIKYKSCDILGGWTSFFENCRGIV